MISTHPSLSPSLPPSLSPSQVLRFLTFYVPLWGAILFNAIVYIQVIRMLSNASLVRRVGGRTGPGHLVAQLLAFPLFVLSFSIAFARFFSLLLHLLLLLLLLVCVLHLVCM